MIQMPSVSVTDVPYTPESEHIFAAIQHLPDAVWLDSGKPASLYGRFDIISAAPEYVLENNANTSTISRVDGGNQSSRGDLFELVQQLLEERRLAQPAPAGLPFSGGLIGYFGYDAGRRRMALADQLPEVVGLPDARLGYYTWAYIANHQASKAWLVYQPHCSESQRRDIARLLASVHGKQTPSQRESAIETAAPTDFQLASPFVGSDTEETYNCKFDTIQAYIRAGDCYQVNLARHFSAEFTGAPWSAYRQLRRTLPSPFSAFLQWQDKAILSLSPERFIKLSGARVETRPIKGTAARGATLEKDRENAVKLMNSAKDRAENLMIVDLLRNDLSKNCAPYSVKVPELFALESFANVHHLVSTVTGTLAETSCGPRLLADCFPGGSITGAPKRRAMEIIEELESVRRSIYCGSIGYLSACGRIDMNIAIRTMAMNRNTIHCWGGGGIVADSDREHEYNECLTKISLIMDALGCPA